MKSLAEIASLPDIQARLAAMRAAAAPAPSDRLPDCAACGDSGFVTLKRDDPRVAYQVDKVFACLCFKGAQKPPTISTLRDAATAVEIAALFPRGIPAPENNYPLMLEACGVGRKESRYSFASYDTHVATSKATKRHVAVARLWVDTAPDKRTDLVLFGGHGTGKTGLAAAIARALIERRERVQFVDLDALILRLRATFAPRERSWSETAEHETEVDVLEEFIAAPVLIIDEITGTKASDFVGDKLRALVTTRQKAERPTILTLNVDAKLADDMNAVEVVMAQMLGPALYDRLCERGQMLACFGQSLRGRV